MIVPSADWKPRTLNVSQIGSNLHVVFDHAPSTFGFAAYFLYFKLRQEGPFRTQRCTPVRHLHYFPLSLTCHFCLELHIYL